jgi:hypothetical protein
MAGNGRKTGFGDNVPQIHKESRAKAPGVIALKSRASAPSFTTLIQQKKNPRASRGLFSADQ